MTPRLDQLQPRPYFEFIGMCAAMAGGCMLWLGIETDLPSWRDYGVGAIVTGASIAAYGLFRGWRK